MTMVMAAGGDGTVRAVAEALHRKDVALALLPSGTGNLLARNLDLTLDDLDHSVSTAFSGRTARSTSGSSRWSARMAPKRSSSSW